MIELGRGGARGLIRAASMSGTTPITEARKRPRRSWPARIARASLWSVLGLVLLLVVAWVFRQQLVVPWLRPRLCAPT